MEGVKTPMAAIRTVAQRPSFSNSYRPHVSGRFPDSTSLKRDGTVLLVFPDTGEILELQSETTRYAAIRQHLEPYSIVARRSTTVNHALAAAIPPCDACDEQVVREAMAKLGQDPDSDLVCVYCGLPAETWDHTNAPVRNKLFSGFSRSDSISRRSSMGAMTAVGSPLSLEMTWISVFTSPVYSPCRQCSVCGSECLP
jgi:hypothetical protein